MSINHNEIFQFYGGYNTGLCYPGYDENWTLGRRTVPLHSHEKANENVIKSENVIELKMSLCSEGRIEKVKTKLIDMDGVVSVNCDVNKNKVTVKGEVEPKDVLAEAKKIQRTAELW